MASSSSRQNHFDLNAVPTTTHDAKIWRPYFVSDNRHLTVDDSVMMNDKTAITIARNFITPMDDVVLTERSEQEAIDDSIAFSIQSAASVSNLADRLHIKSKEVEELTTENSSLQRMLQDSQREIENLRHENKHLSKLVNSYSGDMQTKLDKLQSSNEKILEDYGRLMAKFEKLHSHSPGTSKP